ncbi:hypothetical protein BDW75DRAFT_217059 [Aspergillus navahoensis]
MAATRWLAHYPCPLPLRVELDCACVRDSFDLYLRAVSVAGILLQQLATDWRVHLAGRGVNGIAIGMMFTISPLWIGETCRPELRASFSASSIPVLSLDNSPLRLCLEEAVISLGNGE